MHASGISGIVPPTGKLYVYELRTVKYPKATLLGHETAITCVSQQSYKVRVTVLGEFEWLSDHHMFQSSSRKSSRSSKGTVLSCYALLGHS